MPIIDEEGGLPHSGDKMQPGSGQGLENGLSADS
jgi:hypothetical protein